MPGVAARQTQAEAEARAALLDVESYDVSVDLAADPGSVRSSTVIRFRCRTPGAATHADLVSRAMTVATLNGRPVDPGADLSDGRLWLRDLAASNVLRVDAEFGYSRDGRGPSRFTGAADGAQFVLATCFPTAAPRLFCCFDQPDLRADCTLSVTAPAGWECVGNGAVNDRPAPGEAGTWRFATVPAMRPYELALCAGPYLTVATDEYHGVGGPVSLSVRCRGALAGSPGLARVGAIVRRALEFYERLLGVPCPYRSYEIVFAPGLRPLAMQVPAFMLVSEQLAQRAADGEDDFVPLVLAHEVAHLWFGCLVEGRWWDDLWLAEALATYLSHVAAAEELGLASPWAGFGMREKASAYRTDSLPGTQPVASPVADAADALSRPSAITYSKGASVIRQLAALIGDDALRAGLRDYLTRYGGGTSTLDDLVGCWSAASGRDLAGWAERWLRAPGADLLRPELTLNPEGTVTSFAVLLEPPGEDLSDARSAAMEAAPVAEGGVPGSKAAGGGKASGGDALDGRGPRAHRLAIGVYEREGSGLRRRRVIDAELNAPRTVVKELAGVPAADAFVLNDGDWTFARTRFDERSFRALADCAMDVGDPVTEAVCWNAAWDMTTAAELSAAEFIGLTARAIGAGRPVVGLADLLDRAVEAADLYAPPAHRPDLRERLAAAALDAARRATPGSRRQRVLAVGFTASAHSTSQLDVLRAWLSGSFLPGGPTDTKPPPGTGPADLESLHGVSLESLPGARPAGPEPPPGGLVGLELRRRILATLSARGLVSDEDLAALAADDPVRGLTHAVTCRALRPDPSAKEVAWTAALADGQDAQLALAHASGVWAPGQEAILAAYRDRYFAEAIDAVSGREPTLALRLIRLLYPLTLAEPATIAATDAALTRRDLGAPVRLALREQRAIVQQIRAAREAATTG